MLNCRCYNPIALPTEKTRTLKSAAHRKRNGPAVSHDGPGRPSSRLEDNLTCVIIAYDAPQCLERWLKTLCKTIEGYDSIPIIIINNHAKHISALPDCCREREVKIVENELNQCLSRSWNQAIRLAKTPYVLISNDDVEFTGDWIETVNGLLGEAFYFGQSYCFIFRKGAIRRIGWFDERFVAGYYEDNDYLNRMQEANIPIIYGNSREYPYQGDRVLKHFVHRHVRKLDETNPWYAKREHNRAFFYQKWKNGKIRMIDEVDWYPYDCLED